jgi:hypothetical protein
MFSISRFPFFKYQLKNKLENVEIGLSRFSRVKENFQEINNNLSKPYKIINLKLEIGDDASIYCNDIVNLKVFLDNFELKKYEYKISNLKILRINNPDINEKFKLDPIRYFKFNFLEYGFDYDEIGDLQKDIEIFGNTSNEDRSYLNEFLLFKRLLNTENKLIIFYNYFFSNRFLKKQNQNYNLIKKKNIIINLTSKENSRNFKFNHRIHFDNIISKIYKNDHSDNNEEFFE